MVFAGTPSFAAHILAEMLVAGHNIVAVYTQPDRPAGRGRKPTMSPVKVLALEHNLTVMQPESLRDENSQTALAKLKPDVMVVAAYGLLLPKKVLSIPTMGCINVHASLLPRWRGAAPIQRAILTGDTETGITIMQMDVGLDTGTMLYKLACSIDAIDTAASLHEKLQDLGAKAVTQVMQTLSHYQAHAEVQNDELATYADKISKDEAEINWDQPAIACVRAIHAYNPMPGAFSWLNGERVKIFQAHVVEESSDKEAGTIVNCNDDGIIVATTEGCVAIEKLQLPGSKQLPVNKVVKSRAALFAVNQRFMK